MQKLGLALLLMLPLVVLAGGIPLNTGVRTEFTDCSASGSSAQTLAVGTYLFRVLGEDVAICFANSASTCGSGGEWFPRGTVMKLTVNRDQTSISCRSATSTGDAIFTATETP